eukprot:TRINITY_DN12160_c0_g1_i2.p1 TRINITY_DN12160_c0_g1~~TRINITY_DN12160_c0_g1_i2.p1  ORF type:complete len:189 (-),score=62.03 TRINITY_DN12160_c0_g1_i2:125-691(-)
MASTEHCRRLEYWGQNRASQAFKTAHEDFERARERMREDSEKTWRRWEEESKKFFGKSDLKMFDEGWMSDSIFDKSFEEMKNSIKRRKDLSDFEDDKADVSEDKTKMEVSVDTTGYKPSELSVNVAGGMICVAGKHEEKSQEGVVMVLKEFTKKYSLPPDARAEDVESSLLKDGTLKIIAKKVPRLTD